MCTRWMSTTCSIGNWRSLRYVLTKILISKIIFVQFQENEPYNKGAFRINVDFPTDYPFKPPSITFVTKIYHPNVDESGKICLGIIRTENWKPATRIEHGGWIFNFVIYLIPTHFFSDDCTGPANRPTWNWTSTACRLGRGIPEGPQQVREECWRIHPEARRRGETQLMDAINNKREDKKKYYNCFPHLHIHSYIHMFFPILLSPLLLISSHNNIVVINLPIQLSYISLLNKKI